MDRNNAESISPLIRLPSSCSVCSGEAANKLKGIVPDILLYPEEKWSNLGIPNEASGRVPEIELPWNFIEIRIYLGIYKG